MSDRRSLVPALLPAGGCPSLQLLHAFLYEIHLFQKRLLRVLSPCGLRFLFSLASCMDFLKFLTANSLPLTSAFSVCFCRAAQMLSYIHTHTHTSPLPFRSALGSAFNHCCFLLCFNQFPAILPASFSNSHPLACFVFQNAWGDLQAAHQHFPGWDVTGCR